MDLRCVFALCIALVFFRVAIAENTESCNKAARTCEECFNTNTDATIDGLCGWCSEEAYTKTRCGTMDELSDCSPGYTLEMSKSAITVLKDSPVIKKEPAIVRPQRLKVDIYKGKPVKATIEINLVKKNTIMSDVDVFFVKDPRFTYTLHHGSRALVTNKKKKHRYNIRNNANATTVGLVLEIRPKLCEKLQKILKLKIMTRKNTGFKTRKTLKITINNMACPCSKCQDIGTVDCNGRGHYSCGVCSCDFGYSGTRCERSSLDLRCLNPRSFTAKECTGNGKCLEGECMCDQGVYGRYCDCRDDNCPKYNGKLCAGNGRCQCSQCVCDDGYTGDGCYCPLSISDCVYKYNAVDATGEFQACNGRGICECGFCRCGNPEYLGKYCEQSMATRDCVKSEEEEECGGHGECTNGACECSPRYAGKYCDCDRQKYGSLCGCFNDNCPIYNGKMCSGNGKCYCGKCDCDKGHTGDGCQCADSITDCIYLTNPIDATGEFQACNGQGICECGNCTCTSPGYSGKFCAISEDNLFCVEPGRDEVCSGHGECKDGLCECSHRYNGQFCECDKTDDVELENMLCHCGKCECKPGYSGETCECSTDYHRCLAAPDKDICSGHGTCECNECRCDEGYVGHFCEMADQSTRSCIDPNGNDKECNGHGDCKYGECLCHTIHAASDFNYTGRFCECNDHSCGFNTDGFRCGLHGRCRCGVCVCEANYSGDTCECPASVDSCRGEYRNLCNGRGSCECNQCVCEEPYKGPLCESCPTCPGKCQQLKDCVLCTSFGTGDLSRQECRDRCNDMKIRTVEMLGKKREWKLCKFRDPKDDCLYEFSYTYNKYAETLVHVKETRESQVPDKPDKLVVRPTANSLIVQWVPNRRSKYFVRGYLLGYGKSISDLFKLKVDANTFFHTINNLQPSSEYVVSIRAFNEKGVGRPRYDMVFTLGKTKEKPLTPMLPPIGLKSVVLSPHTIVITWTDNSLGKTQRIIDNRYYTVKYNSIPARGKTMLVNSTELHCNIENLIHDTLYVFSVRITNGRQKSSWSMPVTNKTQESAPGPIPRDLSTLPVEGDPLSVTLNWQPPQKPNGQITGTGDFILGYLVFYTTDPEKDELDWIVEGVMGERLSVTISDLMEDTTYYFKVQARTSKGYGPMSSAKYYTTPNVGKVARDKRSSDPVQLPGMERAWKLCQFIDPQDDCLYEFSYNNNNRGDTHILVNETKECPGP